ncbi:general substrate transporter [Laetiporus sulphureus 93-53]|uniref:General substrate transporter n=1 Tax=Laetiporus sulphureus 93-53 TaxID=1314785 RepID=A0A165DQ58_9APHY|nr:general substrate transporter [Laetiporus sulphureus 93-53]KZT05381.1 general substrate transporter [Laetiporus sulphureus 93-53]
MAPRSDTYVALPNEDATGGETPESSEPLLSPENAFHGGTLVLHKDGRGYTYAYGPKGLKGLLHNYYALGCAVFVSIGGLLFGYDQGVIANVLVMRDFTERWPIGAWEKGVMTAVLELGALIGALTTGMLADRVSRRTSILIACITFCVGSALQVGAQSLFHLTLGRAISGLGIGALSMLAPLYMAEISPPELRGSLMTMEQLAIVLGAVLGFWTGFFTRNVPGSTSWRIPLGIQLGPGILLATGCLFLPPSPRLLVMQGRTDEALHALAKLRRRTPEESATDPLLQIELLEMQTEAMLISRHVNVDACEESEEVVRTRSFATELRSWLRLFGGQYWERTAIGIMMMFFQQWSGINALLYYGPTLMRSLGLQGDSATLMVSGGIGIVQFLAVLPVIVVIDRIGRRPLLRGGSAIMALSHFCIAILVRQYEGAWEAHRFAAWICVGCVYMFTAAYGMSYGPIGWVLSTEVFPLSVRSKGVSLSTASNWFNNFLIGLVTPEIMEISPSGTFLVFTTACFLGYIWSTYAVPETANISLEEMDEVFSSSAGREDADLKEQIEQDLGLHDLVQRWAAHCATTS